MDTIKIRGLWWNSHPIRVISRLHLPVILDITKRLRYAEMAYQGISYFI